MNGFFVPSGEASKIFIPASTVTRLAVEIVPEQSILLVINEHIVSADTVIAAINGKIVPAPVSDIAAIMEFIAAI